MGEKRDNLHFCCVAEDSFYAIEFLRSRREDGTMTELETRQLAVMEKRAAESTIYLAPAVIYAAANQKNCCNWLFRQEKEKKEAWYRQGVAWMHRHPAFLEKFGWKERRYALWTAGILAQAEKRGTHADWDEVRKLLQGGWELLWRRLRQNRYLTAEDWNEMKAPWKESEWMDCGMSGVLLLMAAMQKKQVLEVERIWRSLQKLRAFSGKCLTAAHWTEAESSQAALEDDRINWLMKHFVNPQRPAYIRERTRISSEWLNRLFHVMELAGLPPCVCETMALSGSEVHQLLDTMEDKMTERQYMTFLMLYAVSRELAQAGRVAAASKDCADVL